MREFLGINRIYNTIEMQRKSFHGFFLLVEGDSDKKLYNNLVNQDNCRFQICKGKPSSKSNVIELITRLNQNNIAGVLGLIDADFDHIENKEYNHDNLFLTDDHDLEMMLIKSPALEKILQELASEDKLKKLDREIREFL